MKQQDRLPWEIQFRIPPGYRSFLKTCDAYTVRLPSDILATSCSCYSDARRNALASGYVPILPLVVPYGRTSFHSAFWNAFNPTARYLSFLYIRARGFLSRDPLGLKFDAKVNLALHPLVQHTSLLHQRDADLFIRP